MSSPNRVLQLLGPSTGGIRRHVATLSERLTERGWAVEVAGPRGVMDGLADFSRLDHVIGVPNGFNLLSAPATRRRLARAAAGVDLIHAHGLKAGWLAATLPRGRPPLLVSVHNLVLDEAAGRSAPLLRALEARLVGRVDGMIAVSDEIAQRFTGRPGADRIQVIPPVGPTPLVVRTAREVRNDLGISPTDRLVVIPARLHPQKDLDTLLNSLAIVVARVEGLRVFIFGEGPQEAHLRARIASLGLDEVVVLAGFRPSVADELAAADVVVLSSRWEGSPLAVLETLALGRPIISTPVGSVPSLVIDGVSGRLVPIGDPHAMAQAIEEVLADPAGAGEMAETGRRMVEKDYGEQTLVGRVEEFYRFLLNTG